MEPFSPEERTTIEEAINRAEKKTSGEIIVVVATASAGYFAYALMWAALALGSIIAITYKRSFCSLAVSS